MPYRDSARGGPVQRSQGLDLRIFYAQIKGIEHTRRTIDIYAALAHLRFRVGRRNRHSPLYSLFVGMLGGRRSLDSFTFIRESALSSRVGSKYVSL